MLSGLGEEKKTKVAHFSIACGVSTGPMMTDIQLDGSVPIHLPPLEQTEPQGNTNGAMALM